MISSVGVVRGSFVVNFLLHTKPGCRETGSPAGAPPAPQCTRASETLEMRAPGEVPFQWQYLGEAAAGAGCSMACTAEQASARRSSALDSACTALKEVQTRFYLEFFYTPTTRNANVTRTSGSFSHQSEIPREQLSLPLASPPSPSGSRGILWVVQSIDLWLVSRSLDE